MKYLVFTGSRAEYEFLSKLINLFEKDNSIYFGCKRDTFVSRFWIHSRSN